MRECSLAVIKDSRAKLLVSESNIGTPMIERDSISHLDMTGGCILNFDCPSLEEPNPFTGSVSLRAIITRLPNPIGCGAGGTTTKR